MRLEVGQVKRGEIVGIKVPLTEREKKFFYTDHHFQAGVKFHSAANPPSPNPGGSGSVMVEYSRLLLLAALFPPLLFL